MLGWDSNYDFCHVFLPLLTHQLPGKSGGAWAPGAWEIWAVGTGCLGELGVGTAWGDWGCVRQKEHSTAPASCPRWLVQEEGLVC